MAALLLFCGICCHLNFFFSEVVFISGPAQGYLNSTADLEAEEFQPPNNDKICWAPGPPVDLGHVTPKGGISVHFKFLLLCTLVLGVFPELNQNLGALFYRHKHAFTIKFAPQIKDLFKKQP